MLQNFFLSQHRPNKIECLSLTSLPAYSCAWK